MARRYEHSQEEIKAMVLRAASKIVVEEGAAALNVRHIAKNIGYTVGSVYMVFENMADLVLHMNSETLDEIATAFDKIDSDSAYRDLEQMVEHYFMFAVLKFNRWSMLFGNRFIDSTQFPEWYRTKLNQPAILIAKKIAALHPLNTVQQNRQSSTALWGGIQGICFLTITGKTDKTTIAEAQESLRVLVRSIVAER